MRTRTTKLLAASALVLGLAAPGLAMGEPAATELKVDTGAVASQTAPKQIDVMAIWSHPDDDAGFTTPCGVWQDLYDVDCGIIMITRGEGGSNSVGNEAGPALGLRRENEDRASHVRMGTTDLFFIDRPDFYYNTSAPLTAEVWGEEETLRRIVRVIRETKPSILVGWPPSFKFGHGNHQQAGRIVWEAAVAAADPGRFPEQLTGVGAVEPWQISKILDQHSGFNPYPGEGTKMAEQCNADFVPAADNPFTVVGTWSGYESPYKWVEGNTAGIAAGTPKTWAQVGREGGRAHPTQARVMQKDPVDPTCVQYAVVHSNVPMQPNGSDHNGDDAVFYGAAVEDPGGFPLGTWFRVEPKDYFVAAGEEFTVDVSLELPSGTVPSGEVKLQAPDGWTVSDPVPVGGSASAKATFTVTPSADAEHMRYRLSATFTGGDRSAYNDTRVEVVPRVEARFERTGTTAEYDEWTQKHDVYIFGRSEALGNIGVGETKKVPVVVTNRTTETQSGEVELSVPEGFVVDEATKPFNDLAPDGDVTVEFVVTHTDLEAAGSEVVNLTAKSTSGAGTSEEVMDLYLVPTTVIPELSAAPTIDGAADDVYPSERIDIGTRWEGDECDPDGTDCGDGSTAALGWHGDALYAQMVVVDDVAGAAPTPDRCFGHWLVDSVELLMDPRGNSRDTSTTFKLGMFPYTDDPANDNGPCWSRDADHHQGFSSGDLASTVLKAPNAPGVEVGVDVVRNSDGTYAEGRYLVEVKIPLDVLPAAVGPTSQSPTGDPATNVVNPEYLGFNLTPYDSDNQNFIGETRVAWSAFGSQQSEPYRWGHAYLDGYEPPADRPTEATDPIIPDTALMSVESPQSIYQSATRGATLSGLQPTDAVKITDVEIGKDEVVISYDAAKAGTLRAFLWKGDARFMPVWTSSCEGDTDGFDACSDEDGAAPPWQPDMSGRLKGKVEEEVAAGSGKVRIPITAEIFEALASDSQVLISFAESGNKWGDGVDAWAFPIVKGEPSEKPTEDPSEKPKPDPKPTVKPTEPGKRPGLPGTGV